VDVVFDPVGGPLLAEALKTLAWGAQYLVIGFVAGIPKVPANLLLVKNCTVTAGGRLAATGARRGSGLQASTPTPKPARSCPALACQGPAKPTCTVLTLSLRRPPPPPRQFHGVFWGSYMQRRPRVLRDSMDQVLAWAASGQLRVPVSHRFGLEGVPQAMAALLGRAVTGKVLILPGGAGDSGGSGQPLAAARSRL
jgi:NADPH:quinone reductase-like Zn-dependent oxidoreductase